MVSFHSDAQLTRFMSEYGIATYADHDQDGIADSDVVQDCATYSLSVLVGSLASRYSYANLRTCPMMAEIQAVLTLWELCLRRGNAPPNSLDVKFHHLVDENGMLDRIVTGKLPLVDANGDRVIQRGGYAPMWANLQVDRRYAESRVRVVDTTSNMAQTPLRRFVDRWRELE